MSTLFLFLPSAVLLLAAMAILVLRQFRPSIGYAWLIAAVGTLAAVGAVVFLRWRLPLQISADSWRLFGENSSPMVFVLDRVSWPYVLSMAVVALAFIWTDSARLETEARPLNWVTGLVLTGVVLLAVMAGNPMTLVIVWTLIDLLELTVVLANPASSRMGRQTITLFAVRVASTLLVIVAILLARSRGLVDSFLEIPAALMLPLLLATGLRLGVLPLNVPYVREVYNWRGLGNVVRMIGPASALVMLGRMPAAVFVSQQWLGWLLGLAALSALYGGVMFLTAENELNGRPYWFIALAAIAVGCVLNGQAQASIAWGVALILVGSVIFLYSARRRRFPILMFAGMLGFSGLPFTPAAAGWRGILPSPMNLAGLVFFLALVLLQWGYLRHFLRTREELYRMERWVHTVYPAGLVALLLAQVLVSILGWQGSLTIGLWPAAAALVVTVLAGVALVLYFRGIIARGLTAFHWAEVLVRRIGSALGALFHMNWLYRFLVWIYERVQQGVQLLTMMFEGDGGVLWTLVLLALLVSLIVSGSPAAGGAP